MSFDFAMSRGRFLNARFGVNGSQNAARSFGTSARATDVGFNVVVMRGGSSAGAWVKGLRGRRCQPVRRLSSWRPIWHWGQGMRPQETGGPGAAVGVAPEPK